MSNVAGHITSDDRDLAADRAACVAPRPKRVSDTGLSLSFLADLVEKHLFDAGVLTFAVLGRRVALAGPILEDIVNFLRKEGRVEVRARTADESSLRYALTDRGRASAQAALMRSGYIGAAPVALDAYTEVVQAQSVHSRLVTRDRMQVAFTDVVLDPAMLDRLGPALNSGKAIFVYGHSGTGKSYITQRLTRLLDDATLVPHAIAVGEAVIQVFDPAVHVPLGTGAPSALLDLGHDPRFVLCRRPVVLTGGELSHDMLEVQFDAATRQYRAPLQLKATNGMFILDDLGRQRVPPQVVLNRWIVPMEEGRDYLALATGQHFSVQFDLILVFATNLRPTDLADDAFLRRIGYKIQFRPVTQDQYHAIWAQMCDQHGVPYDAAVCQTVIDDLHLRTGIPLLPCHPRDLIDMALDRAAYLGAQDELRPDALEWAWHNYFVQMDG
jgi:DNA-binding MarR family transcriptional regulator/energy-coupling factor transporter ATP-binding protein EcfA2